MPPRPRPGRPRSRRATLLRAIPGLELVEPAEWELCCGSAGIYNLMQPEAAAKLGRRKADNLRGDRRRRRSPPRTRAARMQIAAHLDGAAIRVVHPIELLDRSLRARAAEDLR